MSSEPKVWKVGDHSWMAQGRICGADVDDAASGDCETMESAVAAVQAGWWDWLTAAEQKNATIIAHEMVVEEIGASEDGPGKIVLGHSVRAMQGFDFATDADSQKIYAENVNAAVQVYGGGTFQTAREFLESVSKIDGAWASITSDETGEQWYAGERFEAGGQNG
jgi:hypothetical protein